MVDPIVDIPDGWRAQEDCDGKLGGLAAVRTSPTGFQQSCWFDSAGRANTNRNVRREEATSALLWLAFEITRRRLEASCVQGK